jgi:hypothetical protein
MAMEMDVSVLFGVIAKISILSLFSCQLVEEGIHYIT